MFFRLSARVPQMPNRPIMRNRARLARQNATGRTFGLKPCGYSPSPWTSGPSDYADVYRRGTGSPDPAANCHHGCRWTFTAHRSSVNAVEHDEGSRSVASTAVSSMAGSVNAPKFSEALDRPAYQAAVITISAWTFCSFRRLWPSSLVDQALPT
jgi:hypothetical protein